MALELEQEATFATEACRTLGFVPGAVAVLGKWEPSMRAGDCLREVAGRAAAALALHEALSRAAPAPYILCAEGHLRRMPRAGCLMAAEILLELGAPADRIRCWPAANCTAVELYSLDSMRRLLDAGGLLLVTNSYHVPRTRHSIRRHLGAAAPLAAISSSGPLVSRAFLSLAPERREALGAVIRSGERGGLALLRAALGEGLAFGAGLVPGLERLLATLARGAPTTAGEGISRPRDRSGSRCSSPEGRRAVRQGS